MRLGSVPLTLEKAGIIEGEELEVVPAREIKVEINTPGNVHLSIF